MTEIASSREILAASAGTGLATKPLDAEALDPLFNGFTLPAPRTVAIPNASHLASLQLQEVTVSGILRAKELVTIDPDTGERRKRLARNRGEYSIEPDGDIHFCLGVDSDSLTHISCELQNAADQESTFNAAINQPITVSGFVRCLFEHPGFNGSSADAHILEIHPVRTFVLNGQLNTTDIDVPPETHPWSDRINEADADVAVSYDNGSDTLTFTNVRGMDTNYVTLSGTVSEIRPPSPSTPAQFTLTSDAVGSPIRCLALHGSRAANELRMLSTGASVKMLGLRNIDLEQAMAGKYVICLLAIDLQMA